MLPYYCMTFSLVVWACCSALDVWHCHSGENARLWAGSVSCDLMIFFMDLTVASGLPLLWGYCGNEVTCSKPHCFANS